MTKLRRGAGPSPDNRLGSINLTALGSYRATIWTAGGALELTSNVL
jgi:hypothetical protein